MVLLWVYRPQNLVYLTVAWVYHPHNFYLSDGVAVKTQKFLFEVFLAESFANQFLKGTVCLIPLYNIHLEATNWMAWIFSLRKVWCVVIMVEPLCWN